MENAPVSITIPDHRHRQATQVDAGSSPSSYSSSPSSPSSPEPSPKTPSRASQKQKMLHARRPSLLSSAFTQQECTTIKIGDDDAEGPLRLITYLASAQGFVWNPEIFVPSYCDHEYVPLELRRDHVHEIHLSDEEIKKMLPQ